LLLAISVLIIQYGMKFTKENDEQAK